MTRQEFLESLPVCEMSRVIIHWTAGGYEVSSVDREHYHYIVGYSDCKLQVVQGDNSILANVSTKDSDGYAAHCKDLNTGSIGIAAACMAGAIESPFDPGVYPLTREQWLMLATGAAELCRFYSIPVTPDTVFQHYESPTNDNGKWDISRLPWEPNWSSEQVCDAFRQEVARRL